MRRYVLRRLASVLIVLWGVTALSFALGQLAPGDPAEQRLLATLGRDPTDAELLAERKETGIDRHVVVRYVDWLTGMARGDLGESLRSGERVSSLLWDASVPPLSWPRRRWPCRSSWPFPSAWWQPDAGTR